MEMIAFGTCQCGANAVQLYHGGKCPQCLKAGDACPKCSEGELERVKHDFQKDGGHPDCSWLICLDCDFQTEPQ